MSWAIGIDFGTSRSAGAISELDLRRLAPDPATGKSIAPIMAPTVSPLEIEGNRWIPSMVLRTEDGQMVVGAAADNLAGVYPDRLERTPKRSLGTAAPLLLGGEPVDPRDAVAAVMRMIVAEGRLRQGEEPAGCVVTHPVRWAGVRRAALAEAAARAGLRDVQMVEEPVAAAIHYASEHVALGAHVGVYDLGGGTFDTALLQRTDRGFEVVGVPGGDDNIGGENFDHRLFRYFGSCLADVDADLWEQMMTSDDRKWKRAALDLLVQARRAKEALSSYTSTQVFVPVADRDIVVNRSQFEAMIIDDIERTVGLMEDTVIDAGLRIDDLAAIFLVGGSSRVPLVAQMVTERFGARVITRDEPKGVVALGAARLAALRFLVPRRRADAVAAATATVSSQVSADPPPPDASTAVAGIPIPTAAPPVADPGAWLANLPIPRSDDRLRAEADTAAAPPTVAPPTTWAPAASSPPPADFLANLPVPGSPSLTGPSPAATIGAAQPYPAVSATPITPVIPVAPAGAMPGPGAVSIAWRLPIPDQPGQLAADRNAVVFGGLSGIVRCVDPANGQMRWQQPLNAPSWAAPALTDDSVVLGSSDGRVLLLDRATGAVRWQVSVGSPVISTPAVVGGLVVVGNDGSRVIGLDRVTGAVRWDLPVGAPVRAGIVVVGSEVVVATTAGQVFVVHAESGRPRWGYRCGGQVMLTPGVAADRVLVPSRDGIVHGLRLADGAALYGVRCAGAPATSVAVAGDLFGVVDERGGLRVHRVDSGLAVSESTVAQTQAAGLVLAPVGAPTVAVVETGGQLVSVDLATRRTLFSVPTGDSNRSVPVMAGGLVCVATTFGQLYGIVVP
ncbi:MAG TPA: Hsp70 family protein [Ilumatobacteraceae bacterium]|nr:Hsp70 family protein [Ilumatobacteraceae bacterium]